MGSSDRKIVLAVTGASGSIYAMKLLEKLRNLKKPPDRVAVIFSETAKEIWEAETGQKYLPSPPEKEYENSTFYAPFASGSSRYDTMIICPSSMGIIGRIANGISGDLISRSADVMLKERRRLIIVPRETPYNLIHIRNMKKLTLAGAIICPASPSFYGKPATIDDLVMTVVDRIIDLAGFDNNSFRWMEND
jgi:4-hydroxy-3-polyprenylbenzoate decarboxylase